MKPITRALALFTFVGSLAVASTIQFVAAPTGLTDGTYYVSPYQITINGASQLVTCYDLADGVNFGDIWQANVLTLNQAVASGYFAGSLAGYKRVAWLDVQHYTNASEQIGLQHAIWDVFDTAPSSPESVAYEAAADAAAAAGYAGFDFSLVRFIEQVGGVSGQSGTKQAFVYTLPGPFAAPGAVAPEPGTLELLFGGLLVGGASLLKKRSKT